MISMISTDDDLRHALAAANNLRLFLAAARRAHSETDYHALVEPMIAGERPKSKRSESDTEVDESLVKFSPRGQGRVLDVSGERWL